MVHQKLKILSLIVRGLRNQIKRRAVFAYLKRQKADIFCLQETYSNKLDESVWPAEWGGNMFFSHGSEHSKGVCMLQRPNSLLSLKRLQADPEGRYIIAEAVVSDENIYITTIYAPNECRQQIAFMQSLGKILISNLDIDKLIITGDWNTTLNSIDKCGGLPWKETSCRNSVINLMEELGLIDVYRLKHPKTKAFTYESKPLKLKSRIDFFFITRVLQNAVNKAEIRISNDPDHKAIFLSITVQDVFKR